MQMIDGNGNAVEMNDLSAEGRLEYLMSYLKDERARDEMRQLGELVHNIVTSSEGDDVQSDAENILYCLEAIFGYESGHFKGRDYWVEVYWDNFKWWYQ